MKFIKGLIFFITFQLCYSLSCEEIENKCEEYLQCLQDNKMNMMFCQKKHLDEIDWNDWYDQGCIESRLSK